MAKKSEKQKMNVIQFMRHVEKAQNLMESIASQDIPEPKVDEEEVDLNHLMDVSLRENDAQPTLMQVEEPSLSKSDEMLVADEFAKMLMTLRVDTVDLHSIGPMATAVAMKNGLSVTKVEDFVQNLINSASERQDNQAIALGLEELPGENEMKEVVSPEPVVDALPVVEVTPVVEEEPALEEPVLEEMPTEEDLSVVDETLEVPVEPAAPVEEEHVEVTEELVDAAKETGDEEAVELATELHEEEKEELVTGEETPEEEMEHAEMAGELGEKIEETGNDEAAEVAEKLEKEELEEAESLLDDEDKELDSKLESIKRDFDKKVLLEQEEKHVVARLEAIKDEYLNSLLESEVEPLEECGMTPSAPKLEEVETVVKPEQVEPVTELVTCGSCNVDPCNCEKEVVDGMPEVSPEPSCEVCKMAECVCEKKPEPMLEESDEMSELSEEESDAMFESCFTELSSLVNDYKKVESAQLEARENEEKLDAKLESIANNYHSTEKKMVKAAKTETELEARLESIVSDYKATVEKKEEPKAKLESVVDSRKKAKARIDELNK